MAMIDALLGRRGTCCANTRYRDLSRNCISSAMSKLREDINSMNRESLNIVLLIIEILAISTTTMDPTTFVSTSRTERGYLLVYSSWLTGSTR